MTNEQIARLMELQKLYEEGILNKDDLAKEKAKIIGIDVKTKQDNKPVDTMASNATQVVSGAASSPVTLKVKIPSVNTQRDNSKFADKIQKDNSPLVDETQRNNSQLADNAQRDNSQLADNTQWDNSRIVEKNVSTNIAEVQTNGNDIVDVRRLKESADSTSEPATQNNESFFEKFKIPILISAGILFLVIVFFILQRHKDIFVKNDVAETETKTETDLGTTYTYKDKYEQMWIIGSSRNYNENDFYGWEKDDLRILRNYFFARNNYIFKSKELNEFFSRYSWYQGLCEEARDDMFTDLQVNNVQFIKKLEGLSNTYKSPR